MAAGGLDTRPYERAVNLGGGSRGRPGVTLVGAGPGDAGMLTLNAVRALQSADVILFDGLVSREVLDLARREAKRLSAYQPRGLRFQLDESSEAGHPDALARRLLLLKEGAIVIAHLGHTEDAAADAKAAAEILVVEVLVASGQSVES